MVDSRHHVQVIAGVALTVISIAVAAPLSWADGKSGDVTGTANDAQDGYYLDGRTPVDMDKLAANYYLAVTKPPKPPYRKYMSTTYCTTTPPDGDGWDVMCDAMSAKCRGLPAQANGRPPEAWRVWSLRVDEKGNPVDEDLKPEPAQKWQYEGPTCYPFSVPGAGNVLTLGDILRQFHEMKLAKPEATIQPVGNVTLVNLPTYFQSNWAEAGAQPDESEATTLVGREVRIKPILKSVNYIFGDGTESGPTHSLGGPYPTGDVTHIYRTSQQASVRIDVTYGGQFSVDGGRWVNIPDEVVVEGTPQTLRVAEAKSRLYNN